MISKSLKGIRYIYRKIKKPDVITIRGDWIHFPKNVSKELRQALYSEKFESEEVDSMKKTLSSSDKVLDIGASIGCVTLAACHIVGSNNVTSIEANPTLENFAKLNFSKNGFNPDYRVGLASNKSEDSEFKISQDFWSSSALTKVKANDKIVKIQEINCNKVIAEKNINTIICDIEGYETILIPQLNLIPIKKIIIELHPSICGDKEVSQLIGYLLDTGFHYRPYKSHGNVYAFTK